MERLELQRFAEEEQTPPGASEPSAALPEPGDAPEEPQAAGEFRQLITGKYRQDYERAVGRRIQAAIQQRFKNQQDYQKQLSQVQPILQALGGKYGLAPDDTAGIAARIAADSGHPAPGPENPAEAAPPQGQDFLLDHIRQVTRQAEEMKRSFPAFDLAREMQNPAFARLTAPGVGLSVKDAFFAVHGRELQQDSMVYAARQAGERIAASVMAGASRPRENALSPRSAAGLTVDVQAMDRKTRAEYRRRIRSGEKINFVDQM